MENERLKQKMKKYIQNILEIELPTFIFIFTGFITMLFINMI